MKSIQFNRKHFNFLFFIILVFGCINTEISPPINDLSKEIKQLLSSSTIHRNQDYLSSFGTITYNETITKKIILIEGDTALLFITPIYKKGIVVAAIESVKIPNNRLPHDDDYAINLVDYQKYDFRTKTGSIEMIDINYDLFHHSKLNVVNNLVQNWDSKGLSKKLEEKYDSPNLKQSSKQVQNSMQLLHSTGSIYTICDGNGDQNISFSECYKCVSDAIAADGFSTFICDIPILGWASCFVSKSATCIVLSSAY